VRLVLVVSDVMTVCMSRRLRRQHVAVCVRRPSLVVSVFQGVVSMAVVVVVGAVWAAGSFHGHPERRR
jgi:hypothetical protein